MQWQYSIRNTIWSVTHVAVRTCSGSTVYTIQLLETVTVEVQEQRLAINLNHTIKQILNYQASINKDIHDFKWEPEKIKEFIRKISDAEIEAANILDSFR